MSFVHFFWLAPSPRALQNVYLGVTVWEEAYNSNSCYLQTKPRCRYTQRGVFYFTPSCTCQIGWQIANASKCLQSFSQSSSDFAKVHKPKPETQKSLKMLFINSKLSHGRVSLSCLFIKTKNRLISDLLDYISVYKVPSFDDCLRHRRRAFSEYRISWVHRSETAKCRLFRYIRLTLRVQLVLFNLIPIRLYSRV